MISNTVRPLTAVVAWARAMSEDRKASSVAWHTEAALHGVVRWATALSLYGRRCRQLGACKTTRKQQTEQDAVHAIHVLTTYQVRNRTGEQVTIRLYHIRSYSARVSVRR